MGSIYKSSRAEVVATTANRRIIIAEYVSPEIEICKLLREYFQQIDFATQHPKFGEVRIGTVHPFALLLFQEVSGTKVDVNLFPSITIADSSDSEAFETLAKEYNQFMLDAADVALMKGHVEEGVLKCSDAAMARLETATLSDGKVLAEQTTYSANHSIDLNIWSENRDVVSLLYDLTKGFIISKIAELHGVGVDVLGGPLSGRRSGDVNVEFGRLLYGGNVTMPAVIRTSYMVVNLAYDTPITEVDVTTLPTYRHYEGED